MASAPRLRHSDTTGPDRLYVPPITIKKRQRTGALQNARAPTRPVLTRASVLECASPLALFPVRPAPRPVRPEPRPAHARRGPATRVAPVRGPDGSYPGLFLTFLVPALEFLLLAAVLGAVDVGLALPGSGQAHFRRALAGLALTGVAGSGRGFGQVWVAGRAAAFFARLGAGWRGGPERGHAPSLVGREFLAVPGAKDLGLALPFARQVYHGRLAAEVAEARAAEFLQAAALAPELFRGGWKLVRIGVRRFGNAVAVAFANPLPVRDQVLGAVGGMPPLPPAGEVDHRRLGTDHAEALLAALALQLLRGSGRAADGGRVGIGEAGGLFRRGGGEAGRTGGVKVALGVRAPREVVREAEAGGLALPRSLVIDQRGLAALDAQPVGVPVGPRNAGNGGLAGGGGLFIDLDEADRGVLPQFVSEAALARPLGVLQAVDGGLAFPLAPEMEEGGLAASNAESLGAPLFNPQLMRGLACLVLGLTCLSPDLGIDRRGQVGSDLAGPALGAVGGGIEAPDRAGVLALIFARANEVNEAVESELTGPAAALLAHGGLAAVKADAGDAPEPPEFPLVVQMHRAATGGLALVGTVGEDLGGLAAPDAAALAAQVPPLLLGGGGGRIAGVGDGLVGVGAEIGVDLELPGGDVGRALGHAQLVPVQLAMPVGLSLPRAMEMNARRLAAAQAEALLATPGVG